MQLGDNRSITGARGEQHEAQQKPSDEAGGGSAQAQGHAGLRPCSQRALATTFAWLSPR